MNEIALRPDIEGALRARESHQPRRLTGFGFVGVFAQGGLSMREVPQAHWLRSEDAAVVNCQCEHGVEVAVGEYPQKCPGPECPRWFFFDGTRVWALNGPTS